MNVTELKKAILDIVKPKSKHEIARINHMYNGNIKYHKMYEQMKSIENEKDIRRFWYEYNIKQAKLERWYKKQTNEMKHSKSSYQDYSHLAYNNVTDDF